MIGSSKVFIVVSVLAFAVSTSLAQDLGSSNKLFGGSSSTKGKTTSPKKPAPNIKSAASKPKVAKPASAPNASGRKGTAQKSKKQPASSTSSKFAEFRETRPTKIEITPAKNQATASGGDLSTNERFEDLIIEGNDARDDRNYVAAEAAYKKARVLKPRDSRSNYGLGNLYSDQQRWEDAETAYRAALRIEPNNAIAHVALSYVLTQPIPVPDLADRYEEAEKIARRAIQLAPINALAFDQLGVALELRGMIGPETENAYRKAIELDPGFAPAYAHLGRLLRKRGLNQESVAAYDKAIKRSNDVATLILVAEVLQSEQRYAESEQLLQRAIGGDPRNPSALLLMGRALTAQAKYPEAEKTLLANLAVSSNGFAANSLLGSLYARQGNFHKAETALLGALKTVSSLEKRSLSMQFEKVADGFMKAGDRRSAERAYRQAIALDAENQALVSKLSKAQKG